MFKEDDPIFNTLLISGHHLPGVWRYMLPEEFTWMKLPKEPLADCDNCPMVAIGEYLQSCRCCTHFAQIPNFQLGLALKDPRTRERARSIIEKGFAIPEGIELTPTHFVTATKAYTHDGFGKDEGLICPFIDDATGECTIYAFRNSICATFHCAHDHAAVGVKYWERIEQLVGRVETALGQWCLDEAGLGAEAYLKRCDALADRVATLAADDDPRAWSNETRAFLFDDWFGREAAFFEACGDLVMEKRDALWEIACERPLLMAFEYDFAVEGLIPNEHRNQAQTLPQNPGEPIPIEDLWYKLQLATRRLWALPYNEGAVALSGDIVITENPLSDAVSKLYKDKPFKLTRHNDDKPALEVFLTTREREALRVFETPQVIGEALLDRSELRALDEPKDFLAECMRAEILST